MYRITVHTDKSGSKEYRPRKKPMESTHVGANALFHCLTHETKLGGAITFVIYRSVLPRELNVFHEYRSTKNKADQGLQLALGEFTSSG